MLVRYHFGNGARIHPVQNFDRAIAAHRRDASQNRLRLVIAQRLGHHIFDIAIGAQTEACLFLDNLKKFVEHAVDRILVEALHRVHGAAQMLNFFRRKIADNFRRFVFTQQHHQDC